MTKTSGDPQTAIVGNTFTQPLVVQVGASNGLPGQGFPVQFSVIGPASVSSNTVNTDSTGRAQVVVFAGATSGPVTVTARRGRVQRDFCAGRDSSGTEHYAEHLL